MTVCQLLRKEGIIFDTDGNIIMCNALFDYPIGQYGRDFSDTKSFINFLNAPKIKKFYEKITCLPSIQCGECDWYRDCGGGCPLRWTLYNPEKMVKSISEGR